MTRLPAPRRFTVDEYYQMAAAGILTEDDRVELIEGQIVEMSPIGSRHAATFRRVTGLFYGRVGGRVLVLVQDPVRLNPGSEPKPDVALVKPRPDLYVEAHPGPADILLVVEIADSSAPFDRSVKARVYVRAHLPELWLIDLGRDHIAVMREPVDGKYRTIQVSRRGERIAPAALPDLDFAVAQLLGD